jgi:hypothetical protein
VASKIVPVNRKRSARKPFLFIYSLFYDDVSISESRPIGSNYMMTMKDGLERIWKKAVK